MNSAGHDHHHNAAGSTPHKKEGMMDKIHDKAHELKEKIMPNKHHETGHTTTHGMGHTTTGHGTTHGTGHTTTGHGLTSTHDTMGHTGHGVTSHGATSTHNPMGHTARHGRSSSSSSSSDENDYYNSPTRGRVKKPGLVQKVKNKVKHTKDQMTGQTHNEGQLPHAQGHPTKLHGDTMHQTHHEGHMGDTHAYNTNIRP